MLEWNVYIEDFNGKKIKTYNIFDHPTFLGELKKISGLSKEEFLDKLERNLMYYFWSKCEWEIVLSSWPQRYENSKFQDKKIDVYSQVMINWEVFSEYVWEHRDKLK